MTNAQLLEHRIQDITFCVVDVETTGLHSTQNRIIEIGIVKIRNGKILERFNSFINPGTKIPPFITQITNITDEDVYEAPFFEDIAQSILDFFEDSILVGHNLQFDFSFIKHEFQRAGIETFNPIKVCTLKLSRKLYPELKSKSLEKVAHHLHLRTEDLHRAVADAELTVKIYLKILKFLEAQKISTLSALMNYQLTPGLSITAKEANSSIAQHLAEVPTLPGVYFFLNGKNEIIYVGKAKSLIARLQSYFYSTAQRKSKKILRLAKKIQFQTTGSELTALLAEAELIKLLRPKHNVLLKDFTNKYFLRVNRSQEFPDIEITNQFDFDGNDYFGLFINRRKVKEVKEILDSVFLTRECNDKEFKKGKACFLAEIERCTAPCVNKNTDLYEQELNLLYEFMFGKNQFALNRLLTKMRKYSDQMRYEKAGEVKVLVDLVLGQIQKSSLLAEPVNKANILIKVTTSAHSTDYLLILEGKVFIKDYYLDERKHFFEALEDFYNGTINQKYSPTEEDLEKLKIILNWIIRNRNGVKIFYLKDYRDKEHVVRQISATSVESQESKVSEITIPVEE